MLVAWPSLVPLAEDLAPFPLIKVGKPGVGLRRGVHLREINAVRLRKDLAEHILAADHHDLVGSGSHCRLPCGREPLLQAMGYDGIGRGQALVPGEDDVWPAVRK